MYDRNLILQWFLTLKNPPKVKLSAPGRKITKTLEVAEVSEKRIADTAAENLHFLIFLELF